MVGFFMRHAEGTRDGEKNGERKSLVATNQNGA
jgi:hypothetical protein